VQLGIAFREDPSYPIADLKVTQETQVRFGANQAPKEVVDRYAIAMGAGAVFPCILVGTDGTLWQGHTRTKAALKIGRTTFPAYVAEIMSLEQGRYLAAYENLIHGEPLDRLERIQIASDMLARGISADQIARDVGMQASFVRRVSASLRFDDRAKKLQVPVDGMSDAVKQTIVKGNTLDRVFQSVVNLARDGKLTAADVEDLVTDISSEGSETKQLEAIQKARDGKYGERIDQVTRGYVTPNPSLPSQLRMHLGFLSKLDEADVPSLVEVHPDRRQTAITQVQHAYKLLGLLLQSYGVQE
jgi:hypothetical protein